MSTVDDDIRTALDTGIPAAEPLAPVALADGLRARAARRRRSRRLTRAVGVAGALAVVVLLVSTVVLRDGSSVQVVADGSDAATPADPARRPLVTGLVSTGYRLPPDLDRSLTTVGDDLIFIGEVRAVGEERPVSMTIPTGPNADIPMPTYDFTPVDVDVLEYLHVKDGVPAPDPIRLRMIAMVPFGGLVGSGTTPSGGPPPLAELLPVGSQILVFASAPVDVGDGLGATPDTVFPVTQGGVIDERGTVVPMDEVRARLAASGNPSGPSTAPATAPDDGSATEPGPHARPDEGRVRITVGASHCEALTTGAITIRVWADPATDPEPAGDDLTTPAGPGWRELYEAVPVVSIVEERPPGDDGTAARSLITVDAPPKAAHWLATYDERGGLLWASPSRDDSTSCLDSPAPPTIPG